MNKLPKGDEEGEELCYRPNECLMVVYNHSNFVVFYFICGLFLNVGVRNEKDVIGRTFTKRRLVKPSLLWTEWKSFEFPGY